MRSALKMSPAAYLLSQAHPSLPRTLPTQTYWEKGSLSFQPYKEGQLVARKLHLQKTTDSKFKPRFDGLYKVIRTNPNRITYVIQKDGQDNQHAVHHRRLRPSNSPPQYLKENQYFQKWLVRRFTESDKHDNVEPELEGLVPNFPSGMDPVFEEEEEEEFLGFELF